MRTRNDGSIVYNEEIQSLYPPLSKAAEKRIVVLHRMECVQCRDTTIDTHILYHIKELYRKPCGNQDDVSDWPPKKARVPQ